MKTPRTNFERALMQKAGLFLLQKSDTDLFLILQTCTITYHQLHMTGIHGETQSSGRLSLKRLESDGYVSGKTYRDGNKFYYLTPKGKNRLHWLFPELYLEALQINFEKRPPVSQLQLLHRIHSNDFYYAYASLPYSCPGIWQLEKALFPATHPNMQPPRCDGCLTTDCCTYYIEQDNHTQSDGILQTKLAQYMETDIFSGPDLSGDILVFTLLAAGRDRPPKKPPFSIYRVLLKALKIWKSMSEPPADFLAFSKLLSTDAGILLTMADKELISHMALQYPTLSYAETVELKKRILHDPTYDQASLAQKDLLFKKRLQQKFYRIIDANNAKLITRLRRGMHLYVLPNHRLSEYLPFLMIRESHFSEALLQCLYYSGCSMELKYHLSYCLQDRRQTTFTFCNVFRFYDTTIVCEDIVHDLGGRERVHYFLKNHFFDTPLLFILQVCSEQDAQDFYTYNQNELIRQQNQNLPICFINKTPLLFTDPFSVHLYQVKKTDGSPQKASVSISLDFNGDIQVERRVGL